MKLMCLLIFLDEYFYWVVIMAKKGFIKTLGNNLGRRCTQNAIRSTYDLYDSATGRKKRKKSN